jgi:hypothetical protein
MGYELTVIPKYVNQPKEGKKYGNIKTADDEKYYALPDLLEKFSVGVAANVQIETQKWGNMQAKVIQAVSEETPSPSPVAPKAVQAAKADVDRMDMFVTAVMGKLFEGTGVLPDRETLGHQVQDLRWAWNQPRTGEINLSADKPSNDSQDEQDLPF